MHYCTVSEQSQCRLLASCVTRRELLLTSVHTQLACILTLLLKKVNAASQPLLCLEEIAIGFSAYRLACILTLLLKKVNAASQPSLWREGLLLISQHI